MLVFQSRMFSTHAHYMLSNTRVNVVHTLSICVHLIVGAAFYNLNVQGFFSVSSASSYFSCTKQVVMMHDKKYQFTISYYFNILSEL